MIVAVNFADEKYSNAQKLNSKTAKKWGANKVIEYSPADIDEIFRKDNEYILSQPRGQGYWLWKPYFILKTLQEIKEEDYLIYSDSGAAYVNKITFLIDIMKRDNIDIMPFCINQQEIKWTKRDILLLMDADQPWILNSAQICGSYIVVKKTKKSMEIISEWLEKAKDPRMVTDDPNVMGKDNYEEFIDNRHDQSIWSVLCKKKRILPYRDPSQFGLNNQEFAKDVLNRSTYPQIIESHRRGDIKYIFQLTSSNKWYHRVCKMSYEATHKFKDRIKILIKKLYKNGTRY